MGKAIWAGIIYFTLVFAAGVALGTLREVVLRPVLGAPLAVAVEVPLLVLFSWFVCRWTLAFVRVAPGLAERLVMGALAFALLLAAEFGLSAVLYGRTQAQHIATYQQVSVLIGLAGQIVFALFPLIQRR
jgi:hypothetical protein